MKKSDKTRETMKKKSNNLKKNSETRKIPTTNKCNNLTMNLHSNNKLLTHLKNISQKPKPAYSLCKTKITPPWKATLITFLMKEKYYKKKLTHSPKKSKKKKKKTLDSYRKKKISKINLIEKKTLTKILKKKEKMKNMNLLKK